MKNNVIKKDVNGRPIFINKTAQGFQNEGEKTGKKSYLKMNDNVNDWKQETIGSLDSNHPFMNNLRKNQF